MLLFAPFLTTPATVNIGKCLDSAKQTIDIIYDTFRHHDFFRTWYFSLLSFAIPNLIMIPSL
jgi:hypothetical protein